MGGWGSLTGTRLLGGQASSVSQRRLLAARVTGVVGLGAYNWWAAVPFVHGIVHSTDGFFSDLSANGEPHAVALQRLDLSAGAVLLVALLMRGRPASPGDRRVWSWLVAFAAVAAVGGMFPYACAAGLDPLCRHLERTFQLPVHHYVHMAAGVTEFFTATMAIAMARITDPEGTSPTGRVGHTLVPVLVVAYPLLAVAYLRERWGAFVEPTFFLMFSTIIVVELFGPRPLSGEPVNDLALPQDQPRPAPG